MSSDKYRFEEIKDQIKELLEEAISLVRDLKDAGYQDKAISLKIRQILSGFSGGLVVQDCIKKTDRKNKQ